MRDTPVRVCPSCGTLNKPKWEYCARCGEALNEVEATIPTSAADEMVALPDLFADEIAPESGSSALAWVGSLALLIVAIGIGLNWRPQVASAATSAFSLATLPATLPPATIKVRPGGVAFEKAQALVGHGDLPGSLAYFAQAVSEAPDNMAYHLAYAGALQKIGRTDEAVPQWRETLRLEPTNGVVRADLARALKGLGQIDAAIAEYREILSRQPNNVNALAELAALFAETGRHAEAVPLYRRAAELRPKDAQFLGLIAASLDKAGQPAEASEIYRTIVKEFPRAPLARALLAESLWNQGKGDDAVEVLEAGIERDPTAPILHRGLAAVLERSGRLADAIAQYREYVRLAPNAADAAQIEDRASQLEKLVSAQG